MTSLLRSNNICLLFVVLTCIVILKICPCNGLDSKKTFKYEFDKEVSRLETMTHNTGLQGVYLGVGLSIQL